MVSAVESLSDEVLRRLDKGHTAADVEELLAVMDAAGIVLHPTLVAFTPWTTLDDYIATVELFRAHGLVAYVPPVQLAIRLLVPPHSALLGDPDAASWVGPLDREAFTHRWTHPDPRMDALFERVASRVEAAEDAGRGPARDVGRGARAGLRGGGPTGARRSHAAGLPARSSAAHRALVLLSGATARSG